MPKHRVLVIDDSFMVRKSLVDQLAGNRFEVFEAKDGPSGLDEALRVNPDVILLDFVMPGMNGFEVYQALRQQPQFANTPVIVISSSREEVIKKFGQPFIGFDFLPKQFTREQLEERIDAVLPMVSSQAKLISGSKSPYELVLSRLEQVEDRFSLEFNRLNEPLDQLAAIVRDLGPWVEHTAGLEERLGVLEQAPPPDLAPLTARLETLTDPIPTFLARLDTLEERLSTPTPADPVLLEHLQALKQSLNRPTPTDRTDEILNRLRTLEQALSPSSTPDRSHEILSGIAALEQRLMALPNPTAILLERLQTLEQSLNRPVALDRTDEVIEHFRALEARLERTTGNEWAGIAERLDRLSQIMQPRPELEPLLERLEMLEKKPPSSATSLSWGILLLTVVNAALLVFSLTR
ncbi:response regulator [Anthocerotibacter panamensis]|uniref:response regulator n=1 Tax=Anthocerotibacter panamensis TaxID=2857077 RepID=UPI001C402091|nr:response regulator [Anthocerotibacter panamensis]